MVAVSVRGLDDRARERLRVRAVQHGRSMEAAIREILTTAVDEPAQAPSFAEALLAEFQSGAFVSASFRAGTCQGPSTGDHGVRPVPLVVLDTDVVPELMDPSPDAGVVDWLRRQPPGDLRTTATTLAELEHGLARLHPGRRREVLAASADRVFSSSDTVLPFDAAAAARCGSVVHEREAVGSPVAIVDAQIATICLARRTVLATRNTDDVVDLDLPLVDPWTSRA